MKLVAKENPALGIDLIQGKLLEEIFAHQIAMPAAIRILREYRSPRYPKRGAP